MSATPEVFEFSKEFKDYLYYRHLEFVRTSERLEYYEEKAVEHELKIAGLYAADDETLIEDLFNGGNSNPWDAKIKEVLNKLPGCPDCYEEHLSSEACVIELKIEDELGVGSELLPALFKVEVSLFNDSLSKRQMIKAATAGLPTVLEGTVEDFVCDLACVTSFNSPDVALTDAIAMTEAAVSLGLLQLAEQEDNLEQ